MLNPPLYLKHYTIWKPLLSILDFKWNLLLLDKDCCIYCGLWKNITFQLLTGSSIYIHVLHPILKKLKQIFLFIWVSTLCLRFSWHEETNILVWVSTLYLIFSWHEENIEHEWQILLLHLDQYYNLQILLKLFCTWFYNTKKLYTFLRKVAYICIPVFS